MRESRERNSTQTITTALVVVPLNKRFVAIEREKE